MATICYGTKRKLVPDSSLGATTCPNCGHNVEMALAHESGYFHIYWIPIFPLPSWKVKLCPNCGIIEKLDGDTFKTLKAQYPKINK